MELRSEIGGMEIGFGIGENGLHPGRRTVVLVHGAGGSRETWRPQLKGLSGELNVIAIELPGHGRTPGPALASIAEMAGFVCRAIEAWELPDKPVLAGHSMGGAVTIEAAVTRPELFAGFILMGTGARLPVNPALFEGLEKDFDGTVGLIGKWALAEDADEDLARKLFDLMKANDPGVVVTDFRACDDFNRRDDLGKIELPTLVICGAADKMTPAAFSEKMAGRIHGAGLAIVDGAGHYVMNEKAEKVNGAVSAFVRGLG